MAAVAIIGDAVGAHAIPKNLDPALLDRYAKAMRYLLLHGIAITALAPALQSPALRISISAVLLGTLIFSSSLALSAFWPEQHLSRFAPFGGSLMILGWIGLAAGFAFQRR